MCYFYSVLCNRIRHKCCCFWLIIQIMYSPANRVFSFSKWGGGTILIMCTQNLPFNTFYMQCILGVIIIILLKKMTIIKLCFIFSHLMFYCYLFFKIAKLNVFFFLRNSVLCIWLSNEGIKYQFNLSLHLKKKKFGKQREFAIKIKKCWKSCVIIPQKNKVFIILVVVLCTFCWTKQDFYFDGLPWIPLHLCVYMIWG